MKIKSIIILVAVSLTLFSCDSGTKKTTDATKETEQKIKEIDAVCIWDGGSIRSIPSANGKYITKMALGEKITWLGISEEDTTSDKRITYHKVRLSDGTEGWTSEYVIATEARPGVIIKEAIVHTRPDLINATDKKLELMDFVAITNTEDTWCEIAGEKNMIKGWVKVETISEQKENVAVALLANKAFAEKEEEAKKEKIEAIINNGSFSNSVFIDDLKAEIEENEEEVIEDSDSNMDTEIEEETTEATDSAEV